MDDNIMELTPAEVANALKKNKHAVVIDVREDDEVATGMIKGAIHIPLENIPHSIDRLDQDKHYIFVCRSGRRSMMAAAFVDEKGFNVSSMAGGMLEWDEEIVL